jgi:hypothetical protein
VAAYRDETARNRRLADYGACYDTDGGRIACEPSATTDRWVLTYDRGLLFYMSASSAVQDVLFDQPQRTVDDMLLGEPL